jgi:hypothetical protein
VPYVHITGQVQKWNYNSNKSSALKMGRLCYNFWSNYTVHENSENLFVEMSKTCSWECRKLVHENAENLFMKMSKTRSWKCRKRVHDNVENLFAKIPISPSSWECRKLVHENAEKRVQSSYLCLLTDILLHIDNRSNSASGVDVMKQFWPTKNKMVK